MHRKKVRAKNVRAKKLRHPVFILIFRFNQNVGEIFCTTETAKKLAKSTHWKPNSELFFDGIPETFVVEDFCDLIKKRCFQCIHIVFSNNVSMTYKQNFKTAVEEMRKNWNHDLRWPAELRIDRKYFR